MLSMVLIVLIEARGHAEPSHASFESALRSALGPDARLVIEPVAVDPPDEQSAARAREADGVVELSWSDDGTKARVHAYLSSEQRWVDREISFGSPVTTTAREDSERERLLGLAVATMFSDDELTRPTPQPRAPPIVPRPPSISRARAAAATPTRRSLEFAGIVSSGIEGTAGGLGATGGLRAALAEPLWFRLFVAGRAGNIPAAQVSTRTVNLGAGVVLATPRRERGFSLGLRADGFASYFEATHFSEDDIEPDRRSRWLPAVDLLVESGFRVAGSADLALSAGLETVFGETETYTHGQRVAVVPPFRAVAELGFRIGF